MGTRNASRYTRFLDAADMSLTPSNATTGVWASQLASNIYSFHKAAAATTSVINLPVPRSFGQLKSDDLGPSIIKVYYKVATADLTSAPTAVLNKLQGPATTGIVARAAVTQALTFGGIDTVGQTSTAGDHIAIVTLAAPLVLQDNESLVLALTMGEAATSVLDIFGMQVTYA
jgi:hypothetical protein